MRLVAAVDMFSRLDSNRSSTVLSKDSVWFPEKKRICCRHIPRIFSRGGGQKIGYSRAKRTNSFCPPLKNSIRAIARFRKKITVSFRELKWHSGVKTTFQIKYMHKRQKYFNFSGKYLLFQNAFQERNSSINHFVRKSVCNSHFFENAKYIFLNERLHFIQPVTMFRGKYSLQKNLHFFSFFFSFCYCLNKPFSKYIAFMDDSSLFTLKCIFFLLVLS